MAPLYPLIFTQWLVTLEYTFTGLYQVEQHIDSSRQNESQDLSRQCGPQALDACLQKLHKWQRRLPFFTSWLHATIIFLEGRNQAAQVNQAQQLGIYSRNSSTTISQPWAGVLSNFRTLHTRFSALALRTDKILNIATAAISLQESKRAVQQSQSVSRITYPAFISIRLCFVSSFLRWRAILQLKGKRTRFFFCSGSTFDFDCAECRSLLGGDCQVLDESD